MSDVYDLLVLGGGSAGSAAASEAIKLGMEKVGMINDGELGGLCILRGCMPTKTMLFSTELAHHARHSEDLGVTVGSISHDFQKIMERKAALVARFKRAKVGSIENGGYEVIDGRGEFVSPDEIKVGDRVLKAKAFVISTGSRQFVPPIPGIDTINYLDSDQLMEMETPPASIIIQGAGPIALEFATFFAGLGKDVTLVNRSPLLLRGEEPVLSQQYKNAMEDLGINVYAPSKTVAVKKVGDLIETTVECDGETHTVTTEAFLMGTGRVANVEGLGLEAAEVVVEGNQVEINEFLQTTNPKVFVAGDATNHELILHVGNAEGRHCSRNIQAASNGDDLQPWKNAIPMSAIFSEPPYAQAGLTEKQARDQGHTPIVAQKNWANQGRGIVMNTLPDGAFIKIIADKADGKILGAQILGPRADDLIHVISTAMFYGGKAADLVQMPWYHPTLSEGFIELARNLASQADS